MRKRLVDVLKYAISLTLAIGLMWYAFRGINLTEVSKQFQNANYAWVFLSFLFGIVSHWSRAYRWKMLLRPLGYAPSTFKSFLAVMVGYFINLVIPRAGEVSRSGFIQRLDNVPASSAFGTIVLERLIDVLILLLLILTLLFFEFQSLSSFFGGLLNDKLKIFQSTTLYIILGMGIVLLIPITFIAYRYRKQLQKTTIYQRLFQLIRNLLAGVLSIRKVENKVAFIFHSIFIWIMYFCMSYVLFFCFPTTSKLGPWVGFMVLVVGALGMAAPVQGGIGAYHLFVSSILVLQGISNEEGITITTFWHTIQTLVSMIIGGLSLLIASILASKTTKSVKENA